MEIRLQKILAQAGYGSRRSCEVLISEGRIFVNGTKSSLGDKADPDQDLITVDDVPISSPEHKVYFMLHKPKGVISAVSSPDRRPTVRSLIDHSAHIYPVGRLDVNSEGLILMTNDGILTYQLTHPSFEHEKEYRVIVHPQPNQHQLRSWRNGIILEDGSRTQPAKVWIDHKDLEGTWLGVILKEGKNRQLRRMADSTGLKVRRLIRTRIGNLDLGDLLPGESRELTGAEVKHLLSLIIKKG